MQLLGKRRHGGRLEFGLWVAGWASALGFEAGAEAIYLLESEWTV